MHAEYKLGCLQIRDLLKHFCTSLYFAPIIVLFGHRWKAHTKYYRKALFVTLNCAVNVTNVYKFSHFTFIFLKVNLTVWMHVEPRDLWRNSSQLAANDRLKRVEFVTFTAFQINLQVKGWQFNPSGPASDYHWIKILLSSCSLNKSSTVLESIINFHITIPYHIDINPQFWEKS